MGDFFGRQMVREGIDFSWFAGVFPPAKFQMTISDCLAFQMAFRAARDCMDQGTFDYDLEPPDVSSVSLGVLEAACRRAARTPGAFAEVVELIVRILDKIETLPRHSGRNASIVAFDIVWKYGRDLPALIERADRFMKPRTASRWGELADLFHGRGDATEDRSLKRVTGFLRWAEFRKNFQFVLENTGAELRRNRPAEPTLLDDMVTDAIGMVG